MSIRTSRLLVANNALQSFMPHVVLHGSRELRMSWQIKGYPMRDYPARLRATGDWPAYGYRHRPCGGTGYQALAQLIRYVRDLPRLPLATWKYWASDKIALCGTNTVDILSESDYGERMNCVLCGSDKYDGGVDWWSNDGVVGPCCMWGATCVRK
jgi:hypothetical protein